VEDDETLGLLAELGCDAAQGFHMARPMPVPGFLALLARTAPEARSRALLARR
jgi:EAL domain-containing protein (putative c-di-GMP-specific phosphodiesterase class I)